jgi:hypothetical protein
LQHAQGGSGCIAAGAPLLTQEASSNGVLSAFEISTIEETVKRQR